MRQVTEILNAVEEQLAGVAQSDVVVGKPIELGGNTAVPISRVSFGMGGGSGTGTGDGHHGKKGHHRGSGTGTGGGSGGGSHVRPVAVVVFTESGVEVLHVPGKSSRVEKLLDAIPDMVGSIKDKVEGK